MSQLLGARLPQELLHRLQSETADHKDGKALLICSAGVDGWPHPAMLSHQELIAVDSGLLRLATYATSQTTRNLTANGIVTVMIVDEGAAYYVKGTSQRLDAPELGLAMFEVRVTEVRVDGADATEGAVRILNGIRFEADDVYCEKATATLRALQSREPIADRREPKADSR